MVDGETGRRVAVVASVAVVAVATVVTLGLVSGAFGPDPLVDAGPVARWARPIVVVLAELAAALTVGALTVAVALSPRHVSATLLAAGSAAAWTVLSAARAVFSFSLLAGMTPADPRFGPGLLDFLANIAIGQGLAAIVVVAALVTVLAVAVRRPFGIAVTLALAFVALAAQAQIGHASGAANHQVAVSAMWMHLVGVTVWIGTLAALVLLRPALGASMPAAVRRFSVVAAWSALVVAYSGVVNSALRIGSFADLATPYGLLVLGKIGLTAAILGLGWWHRQRTLPQLDAPGGERAFARIVAVELAVMGAVSGTAVVLASSAPPIPQEPIVAITAAEKVTGERLPDAPTLASWFTEGRPDALFGFLAVVGIAVYLRWVRRLAKRGDAWPPLRTVAWVTGMVLFAWVSSGGPALYGHFLFSAHMVQHMFLVMIIPIFLALSAPVTLALRAIPARRDGSRGPREWLLALVSSKWAKFFANPIVAAVNFAGSMIVFYYTPIFEFVLRNHVGHIGMIVHFSLAGYLFVNALVGVDPGPDRPMYPMRILLLFATMVFHAFFGLSLVSDEALLAPRWFGLLGRPWGPSALADQQIGGAITWGIGEVPTLALAIAVAIAWARTDERAAKRRDRAADRDGDAELEAYNARLAELARRDTQ